MVPTLSELEVLHRHHSYGWSFECLDVFLSGRNGLDRPTLTAKLGPQTRGGWCFELNEWLALALEDAGFPVRRLMARTALAPGRPRTHQINLVRIGDQAWTADAGFGAQTPREPMLLDDGYERVQDGLPYRMERRPAQGAHRWSEPESWVLRCRSQGAWKDLYTFTLESATPADFAMGNHYHLTSPTSSFAEARIVTRPIPGGRVTLIDHLLKTWSTGMDGEKLEREDILPNRSAYVAVLEERFGLQLSGSAIDRLWGLEPSVSQGNQPLADGPGSPR